MTMKKNLFRFDKTINDEELSKALSSITQTLVEIEEKMIKQILHIHLGREINKEDYPKIQIGVYPNDLAKREFQLSYDKTVLGKVTIEFPCTDNNYCFKASFNA
jgi:hypothetical protein